MTSSSSTVPTGGRTSATADDASGLEASLPELVVPGPHTSVAGRLTEVVQWLPDRTAIESWDGTLTYAELDLRVRALAAELAGLAGLVGDGAEGAVRAPIGLYAEQSTDSTAAFFAVLAAGHPCVVLDVLLPEARIAQIAQLAGVTVVLADQARSASAAALPGVQVVRGLVPEGEAGATSLADRPVLTLEDPASIVFTSGTTGLPKGVVYPQLTSLACAANSRVVLRLTRDDRIALVMPVAFAAGQIVLLSAVLNGVTVCVRDPRVHGLADLAPWLETSRVSIVVCTPSLMRAVDGALPAGRVLPDLRLMATCGEKVYGKDVLAFRDRMGAQASFMNWLGSSETEALATYEIRATDPVPEGVVPAGRPVPLRELEVLGNDDTPVPAGEAGFLAVTSAFLSGGYWGDPVATAAKFQLLPDGRTRYHTGDRGRIDADGILHLLGRADDSVKIRGYLVEPGEVEATLLALPEVREAVVRAVTDPAGEPRLVAWVVPDLDQRTASPALLRAGAARSLPEWMVPRDVVLLDVLPRTERGKVDVHALPPVPVRSAPGPLATDGERALESIWAPILHLERIAGDESFTALGGDSLAVEEMLATVQSRLGVSLTSADLAEHPTLSELAALVAAVSGGRAARRANCLVELRTTGSRPPLFCFAGAGGAAAAFESLAGALGPDQPVYGLQVHGFENRGVPDWTVDRAARRYVRLIEQVSPTGPVLLAGHSLGGLFALAVAKLLRDRGREVLEVFLLDTYLPLAARGPEAPRQLGPVAAPITRRELWLTRFRVVTAGIVRHPPEVQKEVFHQHGARVARFHRPTPWSGRALLVLARENEDDARWWEPLLTGEHTVHRVDADHLAMLRRPHVDRLAEVLTAHVDRVLAG